jgi:hypothetical protein
MTEQNRLAKLLLMLSSDRDGEVVSAARAIGRALHANGDDWHDLVSRLTNSNPKPEPRKAHEQHPPGDWRVMHEFCLDRDRLLRPREREFVASLGDWRGELTERQHAWLLAIYQRLGGTK